MLLTQLNQLSPNGPYFSFIDWPLVLIAKSMVPRLLEFPSPPSCTPRASVAALSIGGGAGGGAGGLPSIFYDHNAINSVYFCLLLRAG